MPEPKLTARQRQAVFRRAGGRCEYCRSPDDYSPGPFSVEHILPRAEGGSGELDNLAWSCSGCNGHKYSKTSAIDPGSRQSVPLFHPRRQLWPDHFQWSEDYTLVIGITPAGRATVEALHLNRARLVNLRRILAAGGLHPPQEDTEEASGDAPLR